MNKIRNITQYPCKRESSNAVCGMHLSDIAATVCARLCTRLCMRTVVYLQFVVHCRVAPACYALPVRCARSYLKPSEADGDGMHWREHAKSRGDAYISTQLLFSKKGNNIPRLVGEVHLRGCSIQRACLTGSTGLNCLAGFEACRCIMQPVLATSRAHVFDMLACICICAYTVRVRLEWMLLRISLMSVLQHELGRNDNLCTGKYSAYLYVRISTSYCMYV